MSTPLSAWRRTMSTTACRVRRSSSVLSYGSPWSLRTSSWRSSGGRGRLPTWVVKMRSRLVFIDASLEPDVLRRQAEFGAGEHEGGAFGIIAGMRPHRMHVAPSALDRVVEKYAAAAARLEQFVDSPDAPIYSFTRVPFVAGTRTQWNFLAGADEAHHLDKIAEHAVACGADLGAGLGQSILDKRILYDTGLVACIDALGRLFSERLECAERGANGRSRDAVRKDEAEGQTIERCVVYYGAGMPQIKRVRVGMRAVFRHKCVIDDDVLAACRAQAHDVPVVVDDIVAARHQEDARIRRLAAFGRRHQPAQHRPLAEIAATGERPTPTETKPAVDPLHCPGRGQRCRKLNTGVFAPDILLRLRREDRQMPIVDADNPEDPGARPAYGADLDDRLVKDVEIELVPAVAPWLQRPKKTRPLKIRKSLVGQPPQLLGPRSALPQNRQQSAHACEIGFRCQCTFIPMLSSRRRPGPINPQSRAMPDGSRPAPGWRSTQRALKDLVDVSVRQRLQCLRPLTVDAAPLGGWANSAIPADLLHVIVELDAVTVGVEGEGRIVDAGVELGRDRVDERDAMRFQEANSLTQLRITAELDTK